MGPDAAADSMAGLSRLSSLTALASECCLHLPRPASLAALTAVTCELDGGSLHYLFSLLPGDDLAAAAQVCRSWRTIATSEALWQGKVLELEPHRHLRRDDLLPAFGGSHRAYYAWRWPLLRRRVGRILVEREAAAPRGGVEFSTWTAPQHLLGDGTGGTAGCSSSASTGGAEQQEGLRRMSLDVPSGAHHPGGGGGGVTSVALAAEGMHQQPTWSPTGALLAYTQTAATGGGLVSSVVVADGATGAPLASWHLATPMPPFYYIWSACGTRLLFLSNWDGGVVALRALDVAPMLLPAAQQAQQAQQDAQPTGDVLLCTERPLFLDVSPTSTRLLWHGGCLRFGLADAATQVAEDGADEDCFFENPHLCGTQAPQWVVDSEGVELLLLPAMYEQPRRAAGGRDCVGSLVLASMAGISEALESEGSRLTPALLHSMSEEVAPFTSARDFSFAASRDASWVAHCDGGQLCVFHRASGATLAIFPVPQPDAEELGRAAKERRGGAAGDAPWATGTVQALQWSPDGRRLLFLVCRTGGNAPMVALAKRPHYRWVVWDAPKEGQLSEGKLPCSGTPEAAAAPGAGCSGTLTHCRPFNPTLEFFDRYLLFIDQYSRSMRFWDPTSSAFCFAARGLPAAGQAPGEHWTVNVHVQAVPRPGEAASGSALPAGLEALPLAQRQAPPPACLAPGNFAAWSWQ
ncbi:F-box WD repeat-containing 7-like [Micractinium conductrix]|uniref:F-box WD repeat-containing 7-like n=1 Tax=Micractinium conductrix TaxID=554055 RepID=A0A2P6V9U0_9CHLO|nr:F-box WD repeat-containing 7-like [Micractinium conductrix]|eukprot:PSC70856.1 F-box WD repeat-containing 7-like [Micractinium conductrix]